MIGNLPRRNLVAQQEASILKRPDVPRSQFVNRYGHKTAFNAGLLIPVDIMEVLPGDHIKLKYSAHIRTSTPFFPLMDSQRVDFHMFYCPNRVVWDNWPKMLGAQDNPGDSIAFTVPRLATLPANGPAVGTIADYFGIPTEGQITAGQGTNLIINALPFRIYNRTWNEWFRSQDLQNRAFQSTADTNDAYSSYALLPRNKSHDYFTMAMPEPQKGPAVSMPVAGLAPVRGLGLATGDRTGTASGLNFVESGGLTDTYNFIRQLNTNPVYAKVSAASNAEPQIFADLSVVSGVSVNLFRQAVMVQTLLEQSARGGTRYVEQMMSIWGVHPQDYRVQRPEYIGGGSFDIVWTPVANTDSVSTADPLGTLGAVGTANGRVNGSYAAVEHGYIITLASVKTELSYQQGIHPLWTRQTRYDFPVPVFAGLGEQPVYRREIFATGATSNDNAVFGYVPRYEEYRTQVSRVSGRFRSNATGTLDAWHFSQRFLSAPVLGDTFIRDTPPMSRVLAGGTTVTTNSQEYYIDMVCDRVMTRPLPAWGIPATLGRF